MNPFPRSIFAGLAAVAASLALSPAPAYAGVSWSIGINVPGYPVGVGAVVSNGPYFVAQPVYVAPPPVVYVQQPRWVYPAPVVVTPSPVYYGVPGRRGYERHRHWHHREDHDDRR
ncbi:MAG: hypothetical protein KGL43_11075 [Burkholderiales bacterium]|nr:hypothetical protein [Burkholderiales bacterium]MDE2396744.1 hypothetical protein [Burkholderiales bacterium]MDE2454124.1 hypothetical protein [Burkholderiales bacterium]